ncbi:hypothetical protein BU24DRAFT_488051 [Aaosphaeria arxii CBS 175.79]|uniref:Uncharacterized protein n=1 Tax=Aaosphaeria arxii CBS 175.79 TaxID=1450172 RepID=A0A6A5Y8F0_9PLEO|nr:uncharacterized protein BU24DRAFT_488051 [Aaosphaeria arxii CBS 175.79]KAF2021678.1 hypothetical protein BU24DRAFT_488051 [Aaosphaeria arxii CBS 175.79]
MSSRSLHKSRLSPQSDYLPLLDATFTLDAPLMDILRSKSPAYLQGKNPYGDVLLKQPTTPLHATMPTKSSAGNTYEWVETSGPTRFTARPKRRDPGGGQLTSVSPLALQQLGVQPRVGLVRTTTDFFENKASGAQQHKGSHIPKKRKVGLGDQNGPQKGRRSPHHSARSREEFRAPYPRQNVAMANSNARPQGSDFTWTLYPDRYCEEYPNEAQSDIQVVTASAQEETGGRRHSYPKLVRSQCMPTLELAAKAFPHLAQCHFKDESQGPDCCFRRAAFKMMLLPFGTNYPRARQCTREGNLHRFGTRSGVPGNIANLDGLNEGDAKFRQSSRIPENPSLVSESSICLDEFEVPADLENRTAYGRRRTLDFGFPGARKATPLKASFKEAYAHSASAKTSNCSLGMSAQGMDAPGDESEESIGKQSSDLLGLDLESLLDILLTRNGNVVINSLASNNGATATPTQTEQSHCLGAWPERQIVTPKRSHSAPISKLDTALIERLVGYVEFAAYEMGLHLENGPSSVDDEKFRDAPVDDDL